ncbi:hypothetical protein M758_10G147800 [Ceratodon purpureus]|nr:hypothetical protein M758_10G147800 [Ceratodon purpureus]
MKLLLCSIFFTTGFVPFGSQQTNPILVSRTGTFENSADSYMLAKLVLCCSKSKFG